MTLRRGDEVPRPKPWAIRFADSAGAKGWEHLVRQHRGAADAAWLAIMAIPRNHTDRQHRLKGSLGSTQVGGKTVEQWEYEATGGGRVRYAIDDDARTTWITHAGPGHPKDTDTGKRRKRG